MTERELTWGLRLSGLSGGMLIITTVGWKGLPGALLIALSAYLNAIRSERYDWRHRQSEKVVIAAVAVLFVIFATALSVDALAWGGGRR